MSRRNHAMNCWKKMTYMIGKIKIDSIISNVIYIDTILNETIYDRLLTLVSNLFTHQISGICSFELSSYVIEYTMYYRDNKQTSFEHTIY